MNIKRILSLLVLSAFAVNAQEDPKEVKKYINWYNKDLKGLGMNTDKAYKTILKDKTSEAVIVAIIDSGVDTLHEDLQGQLWVNEDEIPGNGIDDDGNGYIDDVHGWSFLGNPNGENVNDETFDLVRIYRDLAPLFEDENSEEGTAEQFELYEQIKEEIEENVSSAEESIAQYSQLLDNMGKIEEALKAALGVEVLTQEIVGKNLKKIKDEQLKQLASLYLVQDQIKGAVEYYEGQVNTYYNVEFDPRGIVGDDPTDINDWQYGTPDCQGPDALHGTHVAGIVGAVRGNGLGGDGVAANVQLMSVRAVPNGDERDKDIALAIRYAVDNGAQVINMSFGKAYSRFPQMVYDAIRYAEEKGVLLVHAAGNDHKNIDEEPNFPTENYDFQDSPFTNVITIGASTRYMDRIPASFSNYGMEVDVFAPGYEIYNTIPEKDQYKTLQGTSMAAPMVAGVAALLKSYYPHLTMIQIKEIIIASATDFSQAMVVMPGAQQEPIGKKGAMMYAESAYVAFGTLSETGKVVNVLKACELAETYGK